MCWLSRLTAMKIKPEMRLLLANIYSSAEWKYSHGVETITQRRDLISLHQGTVQKCNECSIDKDDRESWDRLLFIMP
jgi:hypothetical protein